MANPEHLKILKQGVDAWNKWRAENPGIIPDLEGADLQRGGPRRADLPGAYLEGTNLRGADLSGANLGGADLAGEPQRGGPPGRTCNPRGGPRRSEPSTGPPGTDLRGAASITRISQMLADRTVFGNNDLSTVKGLETVRHLGPSTIGIDTIYKSKGNIPEVFLRGAACLRTSSST